MTDSLRALLNRHIEAGRMPGAVALIGKEEPLLVAAGSASLDQAVPMGTDAIVRIQSMTKPILAVATLRLVEAGRLDLDASVEPWLPELSGRRVLVHPGATLEETVPAARPITLRHLLTNTAGYGMILQPSPLQQAMVDTNTSVAFDHVDGDAVEWLERLSTLPLAIQPGEGWRYHHSFAILGILLSRVTGRKLSEFLAEELFEPLGMPDTGLWVRVEQRPRLTAAFRFVEDHLIETEPAGGGFYAAEPPFDVSHGELVSTARDYHRFLQVLTHGGRAGDRQILSAEHVRQMTTDQIPPAAKAADSFVPGFWSETSWGLGLGVTVAGPHRGRVGWSGGQGTTFYVDPDGTIGILLSQVEIGDQILPVFDDFLALTSPSA